MGFRIYEWEQLTQEANRKTRWRLILRDKLPSFWEKQITAAVEEMDGSGVVLGTFAGKLARFDLQTGELHKLADLPTGGRVTKFLISSDGKALAVASEVRQGGSMKVIRAWDIWDYRKLRDAEKFTSRCEKRTSASPTEPSPEDLTRFRRAYARHDKS